MYSKLDNTRIKSLVRTYVNAPQFGLFVGAGVSSDSNIPTYHELALRLLESASLEKTFQGPQEWVQSFTQRQRRLREEGRGIVQPDEVVLFTRSLLGNNGKLLRELSRKVLFSNVAAQRIVARSAFENNTTLDAVLTFCAARPGTVLSPASRFKIETNNKVGGILTTNYDNLLEGAFHTKYRRNLLKPVGRPSSNEFEKERRLIPVYHIHGYLGYRGEAQKNINQKTPDIIIAEDDYFRVFYDPLGFGNYIAMSFLRRFPCLFIGSAMMDKNLRRYLFHLTQNTGTSAVRQKKFAILKETGFPEDEVTDSVLRSYGVEIVWIKQYGDIKDILREMYTAVDGVDATDWEYAAAFRWGKKPDKTNSG